MPLFQQSSDFDINGGNFHDNTKQIIINNNSSGTVLVENVGTTNIYVGGKHRDRSTYHQDDAQSHSGQPTQQRSTDALNYTGCTSVEAPRVFPPVYSQLDDGSIAMTGILHDPAKDSEAYFEWQLATLHLLSNSVGINEEAMKMIPSTSVFGTPNSALHPRDIAASSSLSSGGQEITLDVSASTRTHEEKGGKGLICPAENYS